jgi:broad specificity phosphatase PhoE
MSQLRRIVMVRHGETVGNSSVRFHGRGDPALSEEGIRHVQQAGLGLLGECFDAVVASPLQRSWESARILAGGAPVQIEADFREVDFGRWEGMTAEEIEASDLVLYQEWRKLEPGFRFPEGESRAELEERVLRGLARLQESGASSALLVLHKGPIRIIAARLLGEALPPEVPELGGEVSLTRIADGTWIQGRRSSNPLHP